MNLQWSKPLTNLKFILALTVKQIFTQMIFTVVIGSRSTDPRWDRIKRRRIFVSCFKAGNYNHLKWLNVVSNFLTIQQKKKKFPSCALVWLFLDGKRQKWSNQSKRHSQNHELNDPPPKKMWTTNWKYQNETRTEIQISGEGFNRRWIMRQWKTERVLEKQKMLSKIWTML